MIKLIYIISFITIVFGCSQDVKESEIITEDTTSSIDNSVDNKVTDFKINEEVELNKDTSFFVNVESKKLITPAKLFDYYPESFEGMDLIKNSNGLTSSGLGKYSTSTAVMQSGEKYLRLRLSDHYSTDFIPEYNSFVNVPLSNINYEFIPINNSNYIGYLQWHKVSDYGIVNVVISNRFNLFIEIDGYSNLKDNYKQLIEKFDLKKLKEFENSNG